MTLNIDAILYINLAHRTDRNEHVLREIRKICDDETKIHRIDAILNPNGALGCTLSHIKALKFIQEHQEWNRCLILEDDFTFVDYGANKIINIINKCIEEFNDFDMCVLSHNGLKGTDTPNELVKKVLYTQTTSSYLISKRFVEILINNFKESSLDMMKNGKHHFNCCDIYWNKLVPDNKWYAIYPPLGKQIESYSDVEGRVVNYGC